MFMRTDLDTSLDNLESMLAARYDGADTTRVSPEDVEFHLDAVDPTIKLAAIEVPATEHNLGVFADHLSIPSAFMRRLIERTAATTQNALLTDLFLNSVRKDLAIVGSTTGLVSMTEWGTESIRPVDLVRAAQRVFGATTDVHIARLIDSPNDFSFDAYVDVKSKRGVGGDKKVGDLTAGGLRFGINLKQGLAPWVQQFMYRLACTNGYETMREDLKVDARGQTVNEVIAEIEAMAQLAFAGVESSISHFYDLREQRVDNPERTLRAIARERGLPDRSTMALMDLASGEDLPDEPTMFDVVNLVTNLANSPLIRNDGGRLLLERAGGAIISDHAARCGHCQQKVRD